MKSLITIAGVLTLSLNLSSQTCTPWFPFEKGSEFEYTFYSKKDKQTSKTYYRVNDVSKSGSDYTADISATMEFNKGEAREINFTVSCKDGVYTANLSDFMNPMFQESYGQSEMTITGNALEIPRRLRTGQSLPDANSNIEAQVGPIKMKILMEVTERHVGDKVSVATPVKTFDCFELSSRERIKVPLFDRTYEVKTYLAEGYGQVKSEHYDKKGKLDSYMLLTHFKK